MAFFVWVGGIEAPGVTEVEQFGLRFRMDALTEVVDEGAARRLRGNRFFREVVASALAAPEVDPVSPAHTGIAAVTRKRGRPPKWPQSRSLAPER